MVSLLTLILSFSAILLNLNCSEITYHNVIKQLSSNYSMFSDLISLENSTELVTVLNGSWIQSLNFINETITHSVEFDEQINKIIAINDTVLLISTATEIASFNLSSSAILGKYMQQVVSVMSVANGNFIASDMKTFCAWNIDNGNLYSCVEHQNIMIGMVALQGTQFNNLAIMGDIEGQLTFWNYSENSTTQIQENSDPHEIYSIIQLNATELVVILTTNQFSVWNMNSKLKLRSINNAHIIKEIQQIKNTNKLIIIDIKKTIKIYDTNTWKILSASYLFSSVQHPITTSMPNIIAFRQYTQIILLDIQSQITQILGTHEKQVNQLSQITGTDIIVSASDDQTLCTWNITSNSMISKFTGSGKINSFAWIQNTTNILLIQDNLKLYKWNYKTKDKQFITQYLEDNTTSFSFSSFTLNSAKKVIIGSSSRLLKFNLTTMEFEQDYMELINCLSIAQIGNNQVATGNFSENIYIWDLETNELVSSFSAHYQGILQLIYVPTNNYLISSSYDSRVKIFECNGFNLVHNFKSHINPVQGLALQVNHNQKVLYSSGWDQQIKAWDIETGEMLKQFSNFPAFKILLLENSDRMVAANFDGIIEIFSKSYNCQMNSTSMEFTQCACNGIGKQEVHQLSDSTICSVTLEELPTFGEISSPNVFSLTFLFDQPSLIDKLINDTPQYTSLTIGDLIYGTDYTYTLDKQTDNSFLVSITYFNEIIISNDTELIFSLLVDDYINNNQYILVQKTFSYRISTGDQKSCTKGQYYNEKLNTCEETFILEPMLSLTKEPNVLKVTFLNEDHSIFQSMDQYIEVLSIEGYPAEIYSYTVSQKSFDIYLITFTFKRDILDNPLVTVYINIPTDLMNSGEIDITTQILKINLMKNFYLSEQEQETIQSIGTSTEIGTSALAGLSVVSSFTGSTSCFKMSLLLGLIELLKYQRINYTPAVLKIFDSEADFPPQFMETLQLKEDNQEDLESIPENFSKYEVSPYILNNIVQKILLMIAGIIFGFLLVALNNILKKYKKSERKLVKSLISLWGWFYQWFVWNLVYFILIDSFLDCVFYSLVEVSCTPIYSLKGKFNLFVGIIFVFASIFLIYHLYLKIESLAQIQTELKEAKSETNSPNLPKNQKQQLTPVRLQNNILKKLWLRFQRVKKYWYFPKFANTEDKKQYLTDHEILFNDYKPNAHLSYNFILFELGRLFSICTVIVLLKEYPLLQTILNLLILVFFIIVIFIIKPYKKLIMTILSVCIEFCLISAYMGAFLFAQYDQNGDTESKNAYKNIEKFIVYGVTGLTYIAIVQMLINAFDFIKLLIEKFREYQEKKRKQSGELFQIKQKKTTSFKPLQISSNKPTELKQDSPDDYEKPEKENLQQQFNQPTKLKQYSPDEDLEKPEKETLQQIVIDQ